ncbi:MAG: FAD binding domain-containing protein [Pseudomonadota bacterium]
MIKPRFSAPETLAEAQALLAGSGAAALVAGGQWIVPRLRRGADPAEHLISTHRLNELRGINYADGRLTIGAAETHAAIATADIVQNQCPVLAQIAGQIGDPATRNRGTLGGGLCADAARSDYSLALLGLDAVLTTSRRQISAGTLFAASDTPAFEHDEILVYVSFQPSTQASFRKRANRASNSADAAIFVSRQPDRSHRVAVMGAHFPPARLTDIETKLDQGADVESLQPFPSETAKSDYYTSQINTLWFDLVAEHPI